MNTLNTSIKIVITLIVLTAAILASLAVFGAFSFSEVGENLVKLTIVGGVIIGASAIVSLVNRK